MLGSHKINKRKYVLLVDFPQNMEPRKYLASIEGSTAYRSENPRTEHMWSSGSVVGYCLLPLLRVWGVVILILKF